MTLRRFSNESDDAQWPSKWFALAGNHVFKAIVAAFNRQTGNY